MSKHKTKGSDHAFAREFQSGLTKREYFAAMAMQGMLSSGGMTLGHVALTAVKQADALIEELNKEGK